MAKDMPWQKWDLDDWCDDTEFKLCSLTSQGLLPRLMQVMSRSKPYGHLLISGYSPRIDELSRALGIHHKTVKSCLKELEERGVLKRNEHGLYSQRMLLERDKWLKASEAGKKGGNPKLLNPSLNPPVNPTLNPTLNPEVDGEVDKDKEGDKEGITLNGDFEIFYEEYPRKINKSKALKVWKTRLKEGIKPESLISAAENYATYTKDKEKHFIQHPATFLGPSRAYEDFIDGYPDEEEDPEAARQRIEEARARVKRSLAGRQGGDSEEPPF